jgi:hypothetical protein
MISGVAAVMVRAPVDDRRRGRSQQGWRRPGPFAATAVYVVASLWLFHRLGVVDRTRIPGCACGDQVDQVWFLALAHSSILGGHLSFLTTRVDYPHGINLLDNASLPLLGAVMTPVTSLLGPVGALALLVRLSFVLSATSAFFVLRRVVRSDLAAAVGGAVYGFSPYMIHQGANHVFLVFVPLPPIILYLVHQRLSHPAGPSAFTGGVVIGGLAVVQYFICSEILVSTVLIAVVAATILGAAGLVRAAGVVPPVQERRDRLVAQVRAALHLGTGVALVAVPLLAYPAWYALAGPDHVTGPTLAVASPGIAALSTVLPVNRALVAGRLPGWTMTPERFLGNTGFLGLPLLVVCVVVVVTCRRSHLVRAAAVCGVVAWVLALGPRLVVRTHVTPQRLPFALLTHVPALQDLVPSRLTLYVDLAVAVLVAVGVERLYAHLRVRALPSTVGLVAAAAGVALTLPTVSFPAAGTGIAGDFAAGRLERAIPAGSVVLSYPFPAYPVDAAMLWQAESGMRFSLVGGYGVRPAGRHGFSNEPPPLRSVAVQRLITDAWADATTAAALRTSLDPASDALPGLVRHDDVSALLVELTGRDPGRVVDLFRSDYGPPQRFGAIDLWSHLHLLGPWRHRWHRHEAIRLAATSTTGSAPAARTDRGGASRTGSGVASARRS